ncbi:PREDICTED: uncharacterized protein LOC105853376 [Condylura cristata]|uniref:uncharacterized protein LOC105853376 n=1 Tax=Condylura cristata TaxID=143302 RepID=UPI000643C09A|nr:PREDICTED: uncharacterized protein LOC105853376 [Condylura cristata]
MPPPRPLGRGEFHNHSGRERRLGAKNPGSGNFGQRMRARGAPSQTHTHFSPGLGKSPKAAPSAGEPTWLADGETPLIPLPLQQARPSPSPGQGSRSSRGVCWNGLRTPASWNAKDEVTPLPREESLGPATRVWDQREEHGSWYSWPWEEISDQRPPRAVLAGAGVRRVLVAPHFSAPAPSRLPEPRFLRRPPHSARVSSGARAGWPGRLADLPAEGASGFCVGQELSPAGVWKAVALDGRGHGPADRRGVVGGALLAASRGRAGRGGGGSYLARAAAVRGRSRPHCSGSPALNRSRVQDPSRQDAAGAACSILGRVRFKFAGLQGGGPVTLTVAVGARWESSSSDHGSHCPR